LLGYTDSGVVSWDAATGKERYRLPMHTIWHDRTMAISPDGILLAVSEKIPGEKETKVSLWDQHSGKRIRTLSLTNEDGKETRFWHLGFVPDGNSLAFICTIKGKAYLSDLKSGQVHMHFGNPGWDVYNIAISPDNKVLAAACQYIGRVNVPKGNQNHSVQLWDIRTGKMIRTLHEFPEAKPGSTYVKVIGFSPDGKRLAFGIEDRIFLFDVASGKNQGQLEAKDMGQPNGLAFTPDSKKLISACKYLRVWDVENAKVLHTLKEGETWVCSLALSGDGHTVALGTQGPTLQFWDINLGRRLFTGYDGHDNPIISLAYSPNGKTLVSTGGPTLLWDIASGNQSGILPGAGSTLSFSPNGKKLARIEGDTRGLTNEINNKVKIWDLPLRTAPMVISVPGSLASAIFSSDGGKLFTLESDRPIGKRIIRHWNLITGKQDQHWIIPPNESLTELNPTSWSSSSFLAQNGRKVFEAMNDGDIDIYDVEWGQKRMHSGQGKEDNWIITPSHDCRIVASWIVGNFEDEAKPTYINSFIRFLEAATGKEISRVKRHQGKAGAVGWSPNGRLFASGDECDQPDYENKQNLLAPTIRLWDTATGKELCCFGDLKADVTALTFSPNGNSLVAGLRDGTIVIFDVRKENANLVLVMKLSKDELEAHWTDLAGDDAGNAHTAIGALTSASQQSVPFLQDRLSPVAKVDSNRIQKLIEDLDSEKYSVRQAAMKHLKKEDVQAGIFIQKALKGTVSLETRRRLGQILDNLNVPGPETLRTIRAIMALERIGTPEAQEVLETLTNGATGARATEEAKASLERLKQRVAKVP